MIFAKNTNNVKNNWFMYKGEPIETVIDYIYLGVPSLLLVFSMKLQITFLIEKMCYSMYLKTLCESKCMSWEARVKLYESLCVSPLLYSS